MTHPPRSEAEFVAAIDCRFPYDDADRAHARIDEACSISSNAAFMVAHELARRPRGCRATDATVNALLDRLDARFDHPLKRDVLRVARVMIRAETVRAGECHALMREIAAHPGQHGALAIACFACDEAGAPTAERLHDEIVAGWRAANDRRDS